MQANEGNLNTDMQWYQWVHITHAMNIIIGYLDTCMYVDFPGQMFVIKSVLSWVWLCLAPLFLSRSNVMNISEFVRFFLELFFFCFFLVASSENYFPNISCLTSQFGIVILADSELHRLGASFWFWSHVTCENMHISGNCPYSMWSLSGVPGVHVESTSTGGGV